MFIGKKMQKYFKSENLEYFQYAKRISQASFCQITQKWLRLEFNVYNRPKNVMLLANLQILQTNITHSLVWT